MERVRYLLVASVNATCEEVTSRFFWYEEFATHGGYYPHHPVPNLAQAVIFGVWHYHGVPRYDIPHNRLPFASFFLFCLLSLVVNFCLLAI
jgi:hypothetical protein